MKKIVIAGFGQPVIDLYHSFKNKFEVVGVILDYERRIKFPFFYDFLASENLPIVSFETINDYSPDLVLVINYNKIIDVSNSNIPLLLNIHMGLLPVYRGNNANSLSILNGDRNVGYTLHEVNDILDGGKIYYTFSYLIKENETYFEAKKAINNDLVTQLPKILEFVLDGTMKGVEQIDEKFIYASKLVPEDGIIKKWNCKTDDIVNKNIIFSRPLGTGLKMKYQETIFEINKWSLIPNFMKSKGFPGAIVLKNSDGSVWIKTKDTAISIDELLIDGKIVFPSDIFKIGERL